MNILTCPTPQIKILFNPSFEPVIENNISTIEILTFITIFFILGFILEKIWK